MGSDISREQEETKQMKIQLQIEQLKAERFNSGYQAMKKQQELEENIALNKKHAIIKGGVTLDKDGVPHLEHAIFVSETDEGVEVCHTLFYLNRKKKN